MRGPEPEILWLLVVFVFSTGVASVMSAVSARRTKTYKVTPADDERGA